MSDAYTHTLAVQELLCRGGHPVEADGLDGPHTRAAVLAALADLGAVPRPYVLASGGARVTSGYGQRADPITGKASLHPGIDVGLPEGSPVRAARAGRVVAVGERAGYGLAVEVAHDDRGETTLYGHLSQATASIGQEVAAGQVIARSGHTGRVTGPHLHFEIRREGQPIDPDGLVKVVAA